MNFMREIKIEKICLNIGCGGDLEKIEKAERLLKKLTGREKVLITKSRKRSTFGIAKGKPIGVKVTLRKKEAIEFLKKAFIAIDNKLKESNFDNEGNFSFGVKEYIDLPGIKYDPSIGIFGFDICVSLERAGFRIKRRRREKRKIPTKHKIKKEEAIEWIKKKFGVEIEP